MYATRSGDGHCLVFKLLVGKLYDSAILTTTG